MYLCMDVLVFVKMCVNVSVQMFVCMCVQPMKNESMPGQNSSRQNIAASERYCFKQQHHLFHKHLFFAVF